MAVVDPNSHQILATPGLPEDIWRDLINRPPLPPQTIPIDDQWVTSGEIAVPVGASDADAPYTEATANLIYSTVINASIADRRQLYMTPARGQELWISRPLGVDILGNQKYVFQRVPQLVAVGDPRIKASPLVSITKPTQEGDPRDTDQLNDESEADPSKAIGWFAKVPFHIDMSGDVACRVYYYPYFRAHSGVDGLLGYATTGRVFYVMKTYRTYSERDFPYLPSVIGEWSAPAFISDFQIKSAGEFRVADFKMQLANLPIFYHHSDAVTNLGSPTSLTPGGQPYFDELPPFVVPELEGYRIMLPEVKGSPAGVTWTYSIQYIDGSNAINSIGIPGNSARYDAFSVTSDSRGLLGERIGGGLPGILIPRDNYTYRFKYVATATGQNPVVTELVIRIEDGAK